MQHRMKGEKKFPLLYLDYEEMELVNILKKKVRNAIPENVLVVLTTLYQTEQGIM